MATSLTMYDLIAGQFEISKTYAESAFQQAQDYLEQLANELSETPELVDSIDYNWPEPTLDSALLAPVPTRPDDDQLEPDEVALPIAPIIDDIEVPELPELPLFSASEPSITMPTPPSTELPDEPGDAPAIDDISYPSVPSYTMPDAPVISDVAIPAVPAIAFIPFDAVFPEDEIPEDLELSFVYNESIYSSDVLDTLRTKLLSMIEEGGSGLSAEVEQAIYDRAKARTALENERIYEEALTFWSSRGWNMPTGPANARIYEALVEQTRALGDINEKILIEQARLAQENTRFSLEAALKLEGIGIELFNRIADRTLEAAKASITAAVSVYQARLSRYTLMLEGYKTQATVYEVRIRAELAKLEAYKIQMEGARLSMEVQKLGVDIYEAQIRGILALFELYKAEMQGAALKAEVNKLKLEAYKTTVEVYGLQISAKTAEYNMYTAQIGGEKAKAEIYAEQVKAYLGRVQAVSAYADAVKSQIEALIAPSQLKLQVYTGDIQRYTAETNAAIAEVESYVKVYVGEGQVYASSAQAASAELQAQTEIYRGRVQQAKNQTDVLLETAKINMQAFIQNKQLAIEAAKDGAQVCSQLAASALSAVHAGANIGFSGSTSESESASQATETIYQHVYNE